MNKVTKGFIIAAVVCIVIGLVTVLGAIAGGALGLTEKMAKNGELSYSWAWNHDYPHWFWSSDFDDDSDDDFFNDDYEVLNENMDKTIVSEDIRNLNIDIGAIRVEIIDTDDSDISIHTKDVRKVQIYTKGDTLNIKGLKSKIHNGGTIYIEIPKALSFEKIEISAGATDFSTESLRCNELNVDLGAGQIIMDNLEARDSQIEVGAGTITIKEAELVNADINVGMGNFDFRGAITGNLDAECDMGELMLNLQGEESNHNYDLECSFGSIKIGSSSFTGVASERNINNGVDSNFDLECSMGNLEIQFVD